MRVADAVFRLSPASKPPFASTTRTRTARACPRGAGAGATPPEPARHRGRLARPARETTRATSHGSTSGAGETSRAPRRASSPRCHVPSATPSARTSLLSYRNDHERRSPAGGSNPEEAARPAPRSAAVENPRAASALASISETSPPASYAARRASSDSTRYASDTSRKRAFAASGSAGFLSGWNRSARRR